MQVQQDPNDAAWRVTGSPIGCTASASFAPTAATYAAGDIIDISREFAFTYADGTPIPPGSLIRILDTIVKIDATALIASEGAYTLQCYNAAQPSAQADNDPWTLASADLSAYRGDIGLGTPADRGSALYIKQSTIDVDVKLATSSLHARLVTVPGFVIPAVARQVLLYAVLL